jgi:hypothetical protein
MRILAIEVVLPHGRIEATRSIANLRHSQQRLVSLALHVGQAALVTSENLYVSDNQR